MLIMRTIFLTSVLALLIACSGTSEQSFYVGYVEADWIYVAAPQSGWLASRPVREGDRVSIGQLLFSLDKQKQEAALAEIDGRVAQSAAQEQNTTTGARPAEIRVLEAQLAQAKVRLTQAISERDRILPLVEQGIETRNRAEHVITNAKTAEFAVAAAKENVNVARLAARPGVREAAKASVVSANAQRARAEVDLRDRSILAAVSGRVEKVFHHPGEYVTAGRPVLALLAEDGLKVKFFVPQAAVPELSLGKRVRATTDGKPDGVDATVSFISSEVEFTPPVIYGRDVRDKLVFLVEATIPAGSGFNPGLPVEVNW